MKKILILILLILASIGINRSLALSPADTINYPQEFTKAEIGSFEQILNDLKITQDEGLYKVYYREHLIDCLTYISPLIPPEAWPIIYLWGSCTYQVNNLGKPTLHLVDKHLVLKQTVREKSGQLVGHKIFAKSIVTRETSYQFSYLQTAGLLALALSLGLGLGFLVSCLCAYWETYFLKSLTGELLLFIIAYLFIGFNGAIAITVATIGGLAIWYLVMIIKGVCQSRKFDKYAARNMAGTKIILSLIILLAIPCLLSAQDLKKNATDSLNLVKVRGLYYLYAPSSELTVKDGYLCRPIIDRLTYISPLVPEEYWIKTYLKKRVNLKEQLENKMEWHGLLPMFYRQTPNHQSVLVGHKILYLTAKTPDERLDLTKTLVFYGGSAIVGVLVLALCYLIVFGTLNIKRLSKLTKTFISTMAVLSFSAYPANGIIAVLCFGVTTLASGLAVIWFIKWLSSKVAA